MTVKFPESEDAKTSPRYNALLDGIRRGIFLFEVLLICVWAPVASAIAAPENATSVSLGDVAGLPATQVMVPLYFTPGTPQTKVSRISATVRFENKAASFMKADKGILLDSAHGTFTVKVENDPAHSDQSILHLELSSGGGERFREGVLLFLTFAIKKDAPPGPKVTLYLQNLQVSNVDTPAHAVEPSEAKNGTIQVSKPEEVPYTACFFFSH